MLDLLLHSLLYTISHTVDEILRRQWANCSCYSRLVVRVALKSPLKLGLGFWHKLFSFRLLLGNDQIPWRQSTRHQYTSDVVVFLESNLHSAVSYLAENFTGITVSHQVCLYTEGEVSGHCTEQKSNRQV